MNRICSMLLAVIMGLTGCAAPGGGETSTAPAQTGGGQSAQLSRVLARPDYPDFPARPDMPEDGTGLDAYFEAEEGYYSALRDFRGQGLSANVLAQLNAFAGASTPLVLAGHEGENAIYSPLSLWSALAMMAECAGGDSRQQVLDALDVSDTARLQDSVSQVWRALYTDDGHSTLQLANSIWLNSALEGTYVPETLDALAQQHFAGAFAIPMGSGEADRAVTDWIKAQTRGLIGGAEPLVQTSQDTLALLASALYYRAGWTDEFQPQQTRPDTFTGAGGRERLTYFMHRSCTGNFLMEEGYRAAGLGTQLGEMVFVLPDEGVTPESLLQDPDFLSGLDLKGADARFGQVEWSVPKFDVDSTLVLLDSLRALGITDLLDRDRADLSALTTLDAYLADARQMARVKVDEEGVEAAAVTTIRFDLTSMPILDPDVCVMDLDRPFLFVLRSEGVPLFVGVVNQVG